MTEVWIYKNWTLTLPRQCVLTGGEDSQGHLRVRERGYHFTCANEHLYLSHEDAIEARAVMIRKRIAAHKDRITLLQGEIHMLTNMLPENKDE